LLGKQVEVNNQSAFLALCVGSCLAVGKCRADRRPDRWVLVGFILLYRQHCSSHSSTQTDSKSVTQTQKWVVHSVFAGQNNLQQARQMSDAFWVGTDARRKHASSLRPSMSPPRRWAHRKGMTRAWFGESSTSRSLHRSHTGVEEGVAGAALADRRATPPARGGEGCRSSYA